MNERLRAKLALLEAALNEDGSITPAEDLPEGLLTAEGEGGIESDFGAAFVADSIGEAFKVARQRRRLTAEQVAELKTVTKGRISQIENAAANPKISSVGEHADALDYDAVIVMTDRKTGRVIRAPLQPALGQAAD